MKTTLKRRLRQGFTLVELLVVIIIIAALAGLAYPQVLKAKKKADATQATTNGRQVGAALLEFETEYTSYPDSSTAETVLNNTQTPLNLSGNTSNDMFRQLIASGIASSEEIFYAKIAYTKKPDNVMDANNALANGEVGFGYLMNGNEAFSTSGNPARPIAVTPLLNAQTDGSFDPAPFDMKALAIRGDGSVQSLNIRPDKKAVLTGSKTLTETGPGTVWGEDTQNVSILAPAKK